VSPVITIAMVSAFLMGSPVGKRSQWNLLLNNPRFGDVPK